VLSMALSLGSMVCSGALACCETLTPARQEPPVMRCETLLAVVSAVHFLSSLSAPSVEGTVVAGLFLVRRRSLY
jgi:hypothetical protein